MSEILSAIEQYLRQGQSAPGLLLVFLAAFLEYVFPPFPGDSVTLLGAFLSAWAGWSPWGVMAATTGGAVAGAWADTLAGRALGRNLTGERELPRGRWWGRLLSFTARPGFRRGLARVIAMYRRRGAAIIVVNRFFPGIRALFFVGAGVSSLPMWKVLLWGGASATPWNLLVFAVGFKAGRSWEELRAFFAAYNRAALAVIVVAALAAAAFFLVRRLRAKGKR